MCSPEVMEQVRAEVSRRRFLGTVGAVGALMAFGAATRAPRLAAQEVTPAPAALATPVSFAAFHNIRDLTHTASPQFPMFAGARPMEMHPLATVTYNGFYKNLLTFDEHTGTHMDAPAHFADGAPTADRLPVERFIAPLAVIDISERAATDPDAQLTVDDIHAWEGQYGPLPAGAFVAMYSGWEARLADPPTYVNLDASGVQHYPGFHPDAAAFLVDERDVVAIGVDTLSLDFGASTDFMTHLTVLPAGKYGLENLANLAAVPPAGATIIVGGPKHLNASGGPTRVFALF